jgi:Tfp pilus assembly protein PilN
VEPFFVSEEKLARQAYRYDSRYRLAAFILMVAILLQVPFLALLYYQNRIREAEESRRGSALQKQAQLSGELSGLKETEVQLGQIRSWEPILRGRMPASAVLGAIEQTIPRDVVLSRIVVEATKYRVVLLGRGSFRVPETYSITLEGAQKVQDPSVWAKFVGKFLSRLPPGSTVETSVVGSDGSSKSAILTCKALLQAQANGNYFPLGVNKMEAEENL